MNNEENGSIKTPTDKKIKLAVPKKDKNGNDILRGYHHCYAGYEDCDKKNDIENNKAHKGN